MNHTLYSQDEDNMWVVGIGVNVVDIRTPEDIVGVFKDYANATIEDLNMSGGLVRVFAGRYIKNGISAQASLSLNNIDRGFGFNGTEAALIDDSFFAVDAKMKYDLNKLIVESDLFDPFVLAGGGYSKIGDESSFNIAIGWGFNFWFSRSIGLNFQSDYNHHLRPTGTDYFQHSIGLIFKLNSAPRFMWRGR